MYSVPGWNWVIAASWLPYVYGTATALSVTPSTTWLGNDGSWSPVQLLVGTPSQWVYVLVSTASSETWVIGDGGCDDTALCASMRGGLFNSTESSTWATEGFYDFQMDEQLGFSGYGYYGWDDVTFGTTGVTLPNTIVASVNTTEYWNGFFGLGIVPGNFSTVAISPISGLVEQVGAIPSHSYGYTAGAKYQQKGQPVSLTLGGYDANRFVPNNLTFQLTASQQPNVYLDSISVMSSASSNNWSTSVDLLYTSDRIYATIDSSTPYLWLPASVCERFASSLGLSYNDSLNLYTFDSNSSQHDALQDAALTFSFNISDLATSSESVTITLPYDAFDLQLTYPFIPNTTYGSSEATKNYFPLRQATTEDQYTIGRAFLQEAYLITDYERNTFSVHQAVHISDPIGNTSIIDIERFEGTDLSGGPADNASNDGLQPGAITGIVIGAAAAVALIATIVFCFFRRRSRRKDILDDCKSSSSIAPTTTFLGRIVHRRRQNNVHESPGSSTYPVEMAIESHERYELPASAPRDLESESNTLAGTTDDHSSYATRHLSAYERARLKHEQQSAQLRPQYASHHNDRSETDGSPRTQYGTLSIPEMPSPLVSSVVDGSYGALSVSGQSSQASPVSPAFRPKPAPENEAAPTPMSPPPTYRRISPGNAVYAGRIPDGVVLPEHVPTLAGGDGRQPNTEPASSTLGSGFTENEYDTMGNLYDADSIEVDNTQPAPGEYDDRKANARGPNWPLDEEQEPPTRIIGGRVVQDEDETKFRREDILALRQEMQSREIATPYASRRRLDGEDLVHIPVPAEHRFSWESEDRGTRI